MRARSARKTPRRVGGKDASSLLNSIRGEISVVLALLSERIRGTVHFGGYHAYPQAECGKAEALLIVADELMKASDFLLKVMKGAKK